MLEILFIFFALFIFIEINRLTEALCLQREIPEERQASVFRTINILITILLVSSYIEIVFA